jgi:hypothetical protein
MYFWGLITKMCMNIPNRLKLIKIQIRVVSNLNIEMQWSKI